MKNKHIGKHDSGMCLQTTAPPPSHAKSEPKARQNSTSYIIASINCNGVILIPEDNVELSKSDFAKDYLLGQTIIVAGVLAIYALVFIAVAVTRYI